MHYNQLYPTRNKILYSLTLYYIFHISYLVVKIRKQVILIPFSMRENCNAKAMKAKMLLLIHLFLTHRFYQAKPSMQFNVICEAVEGTSHSISLTLAIT
jgi:hypothetical protein